MVHKDDGSGFLLGPPGMLHQRAGEGPTPDGSGVVSGDNRLSITASANSSKTGLGMKFQPPVCGDYGDIRRRSRWKLQAESQYLCESLDVVTDTTSTGKGIFNTSLAKDKGECQLSHQVESHHDSIGNHVTTW